MLICLFQNLKIQWDSLLTSEARYRYVRYNVTNKVNLIVQFIAIISSFKICTYTVHIIFTFHIFHELR